MRAGEGVGEERVQSEGAGRGGRARRTSLRRDNGSRSGTMSSAVAPVEVRRGSPDDTSVGLSQPDSLISLFRTHGAAGDTEGRHILRSGWDYILLSGFYYTSNNERTLLQQTANICVLFFFKNCLTVSERLTFFPVPNLTFHIS